MKRSLTVPVFILVFLLAGCYPQGPEFIEELDVALTTFKDDYDFQSKSTYAMPDRIVKITGNLQDGDDPEFIPDAVAAAIIADIESNMSSLGWQRVDVDENPDLLLPLASWETTSIFYWYDYWYWWWGGYYPGWGCCWPGYYPPAYVSSYTTGTLVMTLIDPDVESAQGNPISQWTGAISGVMGYSFDASRVGRAIDQTFAQSPYLKIN